MTLAACVAASVYSKTSPTDSMKDQERDEGQQKEVEDPYEHHEQYQRHHREHRYAGRSDQIQILGNIPFQ
ncbi:hypothetical protein DPMN_114523 [Dreissena polymorpha]|uniref:Uncharacterized protein n=1 Tax=Dreissena polymorpha TaxID=45954 RepID=A0A9D4QSX4_DREPO|nr:hypothetical protein DPMN_114523 [Dreissena polymorpha]